ncbi:MAG: hypothetical protein SFU91_13825 [Chloroherpetonaceae bacterium]|nr:hypothetical protein [Chloroherpetonaceae bacterium]
MPKHNTDFTPSLNSRITHIISFFLLLLLHGCYTVYSPERVALLKPNGSDIKWLQGQGFQMMGDSTIKIILAFERGTNGKCVFDVELINMSNQEILTLPQEFFYEYQMSDSSWAKGSVADDPETLILENDLRFASAEAAYKTENSRTSFYSMLYVTSDVVSSISNSLSAERTRETEKARQLQRIESEAAQSRLVAESALNETSFQNKRMVLENERERVRFTYLRKTTLRPSYSINGKIQLPFPDLHLQKVRVSFRMGEKKFSFPFSVEFFPKPDIKQRQKMSTPFTFY